MHIFYFSWRKGAVVFKSLIQEIHSKTLIRPVMTQVNLEWVIESFRSSSMRFCLAVLAVFFRIMRELQPPLKKSKFIQNRADLFAHKQLLIESSFYIAGWFLFMVFRSNEMFFLQKETQIMNTLELKMGIDKNQNRKAESESELIKFKTYTCFLWKKASNTSFLYSFSILFLILLFFFF